MLNIFYKVELQDTNAKSKKGYDVIMTNKHYTHTQENKHTGKSKQNNSLDLIDFCLIKNFIYENIKIKSYLDLSSDHSPIKKTLHN